MKRYKLEIDLMPMGAWNNDFSKTLSKKDWDVLRKFCYKRADGICQICGYKTYELDAHEVWEFNNHKHTQTLKAIIGICKKCHGVIHFKNSDRLGYSEKAKEHFMKVNNASELEFANHLTQAVFDYEEKNKIYRWEIVADLEKFGGHGIEIKQNHTPLIKSPYKNINWNNYEFIKHEHKNLFIINSKYLYHVPPKIQLINVDNYQGSISIICDNVDKIEWYLDNNKILTKYNIVGQFTSSINIKSLEGKCLQFKALGKGGETISKPFELLPVEVI